MIIGGRPQGTALPCAPSIPEAGCTQKEERSWGQCLLQTDFSVLPMSSSLQSPHMERLVAKSRRLRYFPDSRDLAALEQARTL